MSFKSNSYSDAIRKVDCKHTQFTPRRGYSLVSKLTEEKSGQIILPSGFHSTEDTWHATLIKQGPLSDAKQVGQVLDGATVIVARHYCMQLQFEDGEFYSVPNDEILAVIE